MNITSDDNEGMEFPGLELNNNINYKNNDHSIIKLEKNSIVDSKFFESNYPKL